jgi:hypothetical protein
VADAKHTVEVIALSYNPSVSITVSKYSLKCVAFANNASSSSADDAVAGLTIAINPNTRYRISLNSKAFRTRPDDSDTLGAFAMHSRTPCAKAANPKEILADAMDASPCIALAMNTVAPDSHSLDSKAFRTRPQNANTFGALANDSDTLGAFAMHSRTRSAKAANPKEILADAMDASPSNALAMDAVVPHASATNTVSI